MEGSMYLTAEELLGYFNQPTDKGQFVLDLKQAREERAEIVLRKPLRIKKGGEGA